MNPRRLEFLEAWKQICLETNARIDVGPDYYRWFIGLSDQAMAGLIKLLLLDRAKEISGWLCAEPQMKSEQDVFDYIEAMLFVMARGYAQIREDGRLGCYAAIGLEPTKSEEAEIDHKILSSRPLFRRAIHEALHVDLGIAPGSNDRTADN